MKRELRHLQKYSETMIDNLNDVVIQARAKLTAYRQKKSGDYVSVHIDALEIAICLTEFSLKTKPSRPILKEEEQWFNAGFEIEQILIHSEWDDLIDLYYKIVEGVKKHNFFR